MTEANLIQTNLPGGDIEISDPSKLPASPLVSVWMITYNHARYIREALDSVLMQQVNFPYEICLGEDGSNDGTRETCLEYLRRYPDKIRLFLRTRDNQSRLKYRTAFMYNVVETFKAARGRYVAMLEGDDCWTSIHKLRRQVDIFEGNDDATVVGHYVMRTYEGSPWKSFTIPSIPIECFTLERMMRDPFYVHTSSLMLRRIEGINLDILSDAFCGDVPLTFLHLLHGHAVMAAEVMSLNRMHAGGVWAFQPRLVQSRRVTDVWRLMKSVVPARMQEMHQLGHVRLNCELIANLRRAHSWREAFGYFKETMSMIGNIQHIKGIERNGLLYSAVESLCIPELRRIRSRVFRMFSETATLNHG